MFETLLNLAFPKFCLNCGKLGSYLCQDCLKLAVRREKQFCSECGRAAISGLTHPTCLRRNSLDGLICLFEYKDPMRKVLHTIKYRFSFKLAEDLKTLFDKVDLPGHLNGYTLVPLPLAQSRANWRGFNQAEVLEKVIFSKHELTMGKEQFLERTKFNRQQTGLSLKEREKNLQGVFQVKKGQDPAGERLLLFDDVWTTGTTLREAAKVLKRAGVDKVWGMCLATSHRVN